MEKRFELTNVDERPTLWVYEDIGGFFGGITSDDFRRALGEVSDSMPLDVRINSGGGVYGEGVAIHNLLASRKGETTAYIDYLAASAASLIAVGCDNVVMLQGSRVMIHEVRTSIRGATVKDLEQVTEEARKTNRDIIGIYQKRWKGSEKDLMAALDAESWYDAEEAIALGLADRKSEQKVKAASKPDLSRFNYLNTPEQFDYTVELKLQQVAERLQSLKGEENR